jgi:large subunit ribosomal protein L6
MPIAVPKGVTVTANGAVVSVKGPKGELKKTFHSAMTVKVEGETLVVTRPSDEKLHKSLHGLTRTLIANMVEGVTKGYSKTLEIAGVGYKAEPKAWGLSGRARLPAVVQGTAGIKLTA